MSLFNAKCPNCNQIVKVDKNSEAAICKHCGSPFIVEKAINKYNTLNNNEICYSTGNANDNSEEKETLLKRAYDWRRIGENKKAGEVYYNFTEKYPGDYRGWVGLLETGGYSKKYVNIIEKLCSPLPDSIQDIINKSAIEYFSKYIFNKHDVSTVPIDEWRDSIIYCETTMKMGYIKACQYVQSKNIVSIKRALLDLAFSHQWKGPKYLDGYSIIEVEGENRDIFLPCIIKDKFYYKGNKNMEMLFEPYDEGYYAGRIVNFVSTVHVQSLDYIENWINCYETITCREQNGLCWRCGGKIKLFSNTCKKCGGRNDKSLQWHSNRLQTGLVQQNIE